MDARLCRRFAARLGVYMRCNVCGLEYAFNHNCPGKIIPLDVPPPFEAEPEPVAPTGFALLYYFRQGLAVGWWNRAAIRRVGRDPKALPSSVLFLAVTLILIYTLGSLTYPPLVGYRPSFAVLVVALLAAPLVIGLLALYLGICHLIAKWVFGGTGTYRQVVQPIFLSSPLFLLSFIPLVGKYFGGIWWGLVVPFWVLEEAHELEVWQAVVILIGTGLLANGLIAFATGHLHVLR